MLQIKIKKEKSYQLKIKLASLIFKVDMYRRSIAVIDKRQEVPDLRKRSII